MCRAFAFCLSGQRKCGNVHSASCTVHLTTLRHMKPSIYRHAALVFPAPSLTATIFITQKTTLAHVATFLAENSVHMYVCMDVGHLKGEWTKASPQRDHAHNCSTYFLQLLGENQPDPNIALLCRRPFLL